MKRSALYATAAALLAITQASAEVCFPARPSLPDAIHEELPPDCEMRSAFEASFGMRGLQSPDIVHKATHNIYPPDDRQKTFVYDVYFFDEAAAREVFNDTHEFDFALKDFWVELNRQVCRRSEANEVFQQGGKVNFNMGFRLGKPAEANGWKVFPRPASIFITSCVAS